MPTTEITAVMKRARDYTSLATPPGWDQLLVTLDKQLAEIDPDYEILQAKVKSGELRFYTRNNVPNERATEWNALIIDAEQASKETCMACGKVGTLHGVYVLCPTHQNTYQG